MKVWAGLLRPQSQNDGRHLIRQAVDTLAPALPIRVKEETTPRVGSRSPNVSYLKKPEV